jgi:hypothetical protein
MQLDRLSARNAVSEARQSGICENKFDERSSECSVFAKGTKLVPDIDVRPLSARLRCFRKRHLEDGNIPIDSKFEELPRGLCHPSDMLEWELPDPDRLILCEPRRYPCDEPVRELFGRAGELLLGLPLTGDSAPSEPERTNEGPPASSSSSRFRLSGDPGAELECTNSACGNVGLRFGLDDIGQVDVGDI